jgi:hypothetical protein
MPRLLLAVSGNSASGVYSVVGGLRNGSRQYCQWLLAVSCKTAAGGNYSAVFGGADNGANNTGGANNSTSGVYSSVVGDAGPPILPRWLLAVSAALPVAITLLFSAAQ